MTIGRLQLYFMPVQVLRISSGSTNIAHIRLYQNRDVLCRWSPQRRYKPRAWPGATVSQKLICFAQVTCPSWPPNHARPTAPLLLVVFTLTIFYTGTRLAKITTQLSYDFISRDLLIRIPRLKPHEPQAKCCLIATLHLSALRCTSTCLNTKI